MARCGCGGGEGRGGQASVDLQDGLNRPARRVAHAAAARCRDQQGGAGRDSLHGTEWPQGRAEDAAVSSRDGSQLAAAKDPTCRPLTKTFCPFARRTFAVFPTLRGRVVVTAAASNSDSIEADEEKIAARPWISPYHPSRRACRPGNNKLSATQREVPIATILCCAGRGCRLRPYLPLAGNSVLSKTASSSKSAPIDDSSSISKPRPPRVAPGQYNTIPGSNGMHAANPGGMILNAHPPPPPQPLCCALGTHLLQPSRSCTPCGGK